MSFLLTVTTGTYHLCIQLGIELKTLIMGNKWEEDLGEKAAEQAPRRADWTNHSMSLSCCVWFMSCFMSIL